MRTLAVNNKGFTLLELLVVLAIIALVSAVVVPSINSKETKVFHAKFRQAVSVLNYARRIAIVRSQPATATFRAYTEEFPAPEDESALSVGAVNWTSYEDVELSFQLRADQFPEAPEVVEVTFFPQGGSSGGILIFAQNDLEASIRINPITGRISTSTDGEDFD